MKRSITMAGSAGLWLAGLCAAAQAAGVHAPAGPAVKDLFAPATTTFTATYKNGSSGCDTSYRISGVAPADDDKHPVFIYTVGTTEVYDNAAAMAAVNGMAARGYVAAAVSYPDLAFGSCEQIAQRARCVYDPGSASSAINAVCAQGGADCDGKGLVVGGFSQGSVIATLAKNYDPRVAAAWGMGTGDKYWFYDLSSCMAAGTHALPDDRLRIADGIKDEFLSGLSGDGSVLQSQVVTGLTGCDPAQPSCYRDNGSGYHVVQEDEVGDGKADHCYMRPNGCLSTQYRLNPVWEDGTADWSLNSELDWLYGFTQH